MHFHTLAAAVLILIQAVSSRADDYGTLNPDDTGRDMLLRKIDMGARDTVTCSLAFNSTKYDDHERARNIANACAEAGNTKAMTWMSQLEANGIAGPVNPEAAAQWDRRAAEAGDAVGQFNYGVDLLRGFGVARNEDLGRLYVDKAARQGLDIAKQLVMTHYDLKAVLPDLP